MKRLRYAPAAAPGRGKPPSKNALLHSQQRTTKLLSAFAEQNTYLENNLQHARAEAHNATQRLQQIFDTRVTSPINFGRRDQIIDCSIRIDAGLPYRDPAGILFEAVAQLLTKIMESAPQLMLGSQKDFFKRLRQVPARHRHEKLYLIWQALCEHSGRLQTPTPEQAELAQLFRHGLHPYTFTLLLSAAAEHAHLLDENPRQIPPGPRVG